MAALQPPSQGQLQSEKGATAESSGDVESLAGELERCMVYFRLFVPGKAEEWEEGEGGTHWYRFKAGEGGYHIRSPIELDPFSITNQSATTTIVGLGSKLYCLGGGSFGVRETDCSNEVTCLDTSCSTDEWKRVSPMNAGRVKPKALVFSDMIYVFGGIRPCDMTWAEVYNPSSWGEVYDPSLNVWKILSVPKCEEASGTTWQEVLDLDYDPENPFKRFDFTVTRKDERSILMCSWKGSFVYDILGNTLTAFNFTIPSYFFMDVEPPDLIDDCLYMIHYIFGTS